MIFQPFTGAGYLIQGLRLILQPGIRRYVIMPMLINILLFGALIWAGVSQFDPLMAYVLTLLPEWLQWLQWLLWPLAMIAVLLIGFFTVSLLANLVAAPFNDLLVSAVERHLGMAKKGSDDSWTALLTSIGPTIASEAHKLVYFLLRALPFLILFLIPVLNVAAPVLWLLFSAWMLALEYTDYPMSQHGIQFKELHHKVKGKRLLALGFGGAVLCLTVIPVINFVVIPAAVAGATVMYSKEWDNSTNTPHTTYP